MSRSSTTRILAPEAFTLEMQNEPDWGAKFSPCRSWRYSLHRIWDPNKKLVGFVLLHASEKPESAIDKCGYWAKRWGYGGFYVVCLFAVCARSPKEMRGAADAIGPKNNAAITNVAKQCDMMVCAWGNHGTHLGRNEDVLKLLQKSGTRVAALNINEANVGLQPSHPKFLKGDLDPIDYPRPPEVALAAPQRPAAVDTTLKLFP